MMEQQQQSFSLGGSKRTLEEDEESYHSLSKRPSFSSIYSEITVSDTETPSGSPRVNNSGYNNNHLLANGSNSPRNHPPQGRTLSLNHISFNPNPSSSFGPSSYHFNEMDQNKEGNQQFPAASLLSLPPSILSLIPNSILKSEPISSSIQQKLENHFHAEQMAANSSSNYYSDSRFPPSSRQHHSLPHPLSHSHSLPHSFAPSSSSSSSGHPSSSNPSSSSVNPHPSNPSSNSSVAYVNHPPPHSLQHPSHFPSSLPHSHSHAGHVQHASHSGGGHALSHSQSLGHPLPHSLPFDPNYPSYSVPMHYDSMAGQPGGGGGYGGMNGEQEWMQSHSFHPSMGEYDPNSQPSLGYQSPFVPYSSEWQSYEIDIANADPDNSNRFYLATQPNPIQRKCYKSEKRYLLPNPMIVKAKDSFKGVIDRGVVQVSVVDEKGDDVGKKQEDLLSCNVGLSRNFSKGNTEIKYAIKLLENSGPIRFRLLFKVTYLTTFGSTVTETLYSSPFIVSHKTSNSSILLHTNAINSSASLNSPASTFGGYPNVNMNQPHSPLNLQFNRMSLNHPQQHPLHHPLSIPQHQHQHQQPHYNTPATSASSSRRSSVSSLNRGT